MSTFTQKMRRIYTIVVHSNRRVLHKKHTPPYTLWCSQYLICSKT